MFRVWGNVFEAWEEVWKRCWDGGKKCWVGAGKGEVGVGGSVGRNVGQSGGAGKCGKKGGVTIWDPNSPDLNPPDPNFLNPNSPIHGVLQSLFEQFLGGSEV